MSHSPDAALERLLPYDPRFPLAIDGLRVTRPEAHVAAPGLSNVAAATPVAADDFYIEVVARDGRATAVEIRIRLDTVEVIHHGRQMAIFDRDALRMWWDAPNGQFGVDDVTWNVDHGDGPRLRVAISFPSVEGWTLSPRDDQEMYRQLTGHADI